MNQHRTTMVSEVKRARELRAAGASYDEVCRVLRRSKQWVERHAKDVPGAKRRSPKPSAGTREQAIELCRQGMKRADIARQLGVTRHYVRVWCLNVVSKEREQMNGRITTTHEVREAREMRARGRPLRVIAHHMKRSMSWAREHTRGVEGARTRKPAARPETIEAARRMRRDGVPVRQIADHLGETYDLTRSWVVGIKPRAETKRSARAVQMADEGLSNADIAAVLRYKSSDVVAVVISQYRRRQKMEAAE